MQVIVKGHHAQVSDAIKERATHKVERVRRFFDRILTLEIEFSDNGGGRVAAVKHRVEVTLTTKQHVLRAKAAGPDPLTAVDRVVDKLETQVRRLKGKVTRKGRVTGPRVESIRTSPNATQMLAQGTAPTLPIQSAKGSGGKIGGSAAAAHDEREALAENGTPLAKSPDAIRVLIVDDHALFRRGLLMVLEQEEDIAVVGEASDGQEAVEKAQETMPDVVLMDVRMPKRGGIEATKQVKELVPHSKILMLTVSDEDADLYDSIKAGATGYLLKDTSIEEVGDAIRKVQDGQSLISPSMASKLLSEFATMVKRADEKQSVPQPRLTDREMEVLKLVAKGRNNRDIAKELFISENTVKNHIRNILEKLHLHSRMEAVVYAVREKLLEIK